MLFQVLSSLSRKILFCFWYFKINSKEERANVETEGKNSRLYMVSWLN